MADAGLVTPEPGERRRVRYRLQVRTRAARPAVSRRSRPRLGRPARRPAALSHGPVNAAAMSDTTDTFDDEVRGGRRVAAEPSSARRSAASYPVGAKASSGRIDLGLLRVAVTTTMVRGSRLLYLEVRCAPARGGAPSAAGGASCTATPGSSTPRRLEPATPRKMLAVRRRHEKTPSILRPARHTSNPAASQRGH